MTASRGRRFRRFFFVCLRKLSRRSPAARLSCCPFTGRRQRFMFQFRREGPKVVSISTSKVEAVRVRGVRTICPSGSEDFTLLQLIADWTHCVFADKVPVFQNFLRAATSEVLQVPRSSLEFIMTGGRNRLNMGRLVKNDIEASKLLPVPANRHPTPFD